MEPLLTVSLVICCQALVYRAVVRPRIVGWGASAAERRGPLPGDPPVPLPGRSTRAITIDARRPEVWSWLIQLGADRGGFFSYCLIEKLMGYGHRGTELFPRFTDLEVGRVVPGSREGSRPWIEYGFPVLAVEPGRYFVLGDWGTFHLEELDGDRTRLVVRTQGQEPSGPVGRIVDSAFLPLHYLMERRMLLGFKARAEAGAGVRLSGVPDVLWLAGMASSGPGTALLALVGTGTAGTVLAVALGTGWLLTLLLLPPRPAYSTAFLVLVASALVATF